jgi:hypothetical protein
VETAKRFIKNKVAPKIRLFALICYPHHFRRTHLMESGIELNIINGELSSLN